MLYKERCPLYETYADITVASAAATPEQVVTAILEQLRRPRTGRA
jgi:shikimate kinase